MRVRAASSMDIAAFFRSSAAKPIRSKIGAGTDDAMLSAASAGAR
jgi:hypothetical protein